MTEYDFIWEGLKGVLAKYAVRKGVFTLRSGKTSDFYVDCRPVLLDSYGLEAAGALLHKLCHNTVAGTGLGGTLLIGATMLASSGTRNSIYVRSEKKDHGTKNMIELCYEKNDLITVVDDVLTTGSSISHCMDALRADGFGMQISNIAVLVDREESGRETLEKKYGIPVGSVYKRSDFE